MNWIEYMATRPRVTLISLLLLVIMVTGCEDKKFSVVPMPNRHVLDLSSDDIVQIMSRAGFTEDQILKIGPQVRSGLLGSGAVQIRIGDYVEAIFAVQGDNVYVCTHLRGSFIYNVKRGWMQTGDVGNASPKPKQPQPPTPPSSETPDQTPKKNGTPKELPQTQVNAGANKGPRLEPLQFYN